MSEQVFLDASKRFALRREAASLGGDTNELSTIKEVMAQEPARFLSAVAEDSEQTSTALRSVLADEMGARVLTSDPQTVEDDDILPGVDFGVVYTKGTKRAVKPNMYLSLGTIGTLQKQFDSLLDDEDDITSKQRLEGAVVAGTWLALGKWTVDVIDPSYIQSPDTSVAAVRAVSVFTGVEIDQVDVAEQQEQINDSLLVLSYRMAGAMAYKGLARYLKREGLPRAESVSLYQKMFESFYDTQVRKDQTGITPLSFALAKPLLAREVKEVFACLGPVAEELQRQNRLAQLEY